MLDTRSTSDFKRAETRRCRSRSSSSCSRSARSSQLRAVVLGFTAVLAAIGVASSSATLPRPTSTTRDPADRHGRRRRLLALLSQARARGARRRADAREALRVASATSGRAILVSGLTVMVAMAGMLLRRQPDLHVVRRRHDDRRRRRDDRLADGSSGDPRAARRRIDQGRIPFLRRRARARESRFWSAILDRVYRRRRSRVLLAPRSLLVLASPCSACTPSCRLHRPAAEPAVSRPTIEIQKAFPGAQSPAVVVVRATN